MRADEVKLEGIGSASGGFGDLGLSSVRGASDYHIVTCRLSFLGGDNLRGSSVDRPGQTDEECRHA